MKTSLLKKCLTLIVLLISILNGLLAFERLDETKELSFLTNIKDSLVLVHPVIKKVVQILPGNEVKIWLPGNKVEGIVKEIDNGTLLLLSDSEVLPIKINEISKIRLMKSKNAKLRGTILIVAGAGALAVASGIIVLFAAAGTIDAWTIAFVSVFAGPPTVLGAAGIWGGLIVRGKNYTIKNDGWNFQ